MSQITRTAPNLPLIPMAVPATPDVETPGPQRAATPPRAAVHARCAVQQLLDRGITAARPPSFVPPNGDIADAGVWNLMRQATMVVRQLPHRELPVPNAQRPLVTPHYEKPGDAATLRHADVQLRAYERILEITPKATRPSSDLSVQARGIDRRVAAVLHALGQVDAGTRDLQAPANSTGMRRVIEQVRENLDEAGFRSSYNDHGYFTKPGIVSH